MRRYLHIWTALITVFAVNLALANSSSNHQEQEQDGRRKSNQTMIRPDGEVGSESDQNLQIESSEANSSQNEGGRTNSINIENSDAKVDSLEDDSVSKYNFIFYFLYKFKYDTEESP
ncbi:hypothetical protein [Ekhidna sp.]|uniref:hypothetical protein n=1 Tax=Ekhidna sp. TaxID=2608089 RepID=UPI0032986771